MNKWLFEGRHLQNLLTNYQNIHNNQFWQHKIRCSGHVLSQCLGKGHSIGFQETERVAPAAN